MGNGNGVLGQSVAVAGMDEDPLLEQVVECGTESGRAHAAELTQGMESQGAVLTGEGLTDPLGG